MRHCALLLLACVPFAVAGQSTGTIDGRFVAPEGTQRVAAVEGSFAAYLRQMPLAPPGAPVLLHTGHLKHRQDVHAAVIDLSVGQRDLQQCADAVMRLRAEFLYAAGRPDEIAFDFTNGFRAEWQRWRRGERIHVSGNRCSWVSGAKADSSHTELLRFMDRVFMYAGTLSLAKELQDAASFPIQPGDVFIKGGSPGHAMIVVDVARTKSGRTFFLLAQSYMPAQQIHVVLNSDSRAGAWYALEGDLLRTPEWTFAWTDRKRWP
jgi:hypothetical protein